LYGYVWEDPVNWVDDSGLNGFIIFARPPLIIRPVIRPGYRPYVPSKPLPKGSNGQHKPDCDLPHTQLGTRSGKKGDYPQTKEWGAKGDRGYDNNTPKNRTDWTDHGRPNHTDPHRHPFNPKTGDGKKTPREPVYFPLGDIIANFELKDIYV
jgi:hypothetical protein